jgi:DNA topoisomerase-1
MKLRLQLFTLEPKAKKRHPELAEDESDMDEDFCERHEADLLEKALEGAKKKFDRDNIKLEDSKEPKVPKSELDEKLKIIKAEFKELKKERKSRKVEPRKGSKLMSLQMRVRTDSQLPRRNSLNRSERWTRGLLLSKSRCLIVITSRTSLSVLLSMSPIMHKALLMIRINYIDPRITVSWSKKYGVPLEKLFSKTL